MITGLLIFWVALIAGFVGALTNDALRRSRTPGTVWFELRDGFRRDAKLSELSVPARWLLLSLVSGGFAVFALVLGALS